MKHLLFVVALLLTGIFVLSACAAPAAPAPDAADCSNLLANSKINLEGAWANATNSGQPPAAMTPGSMGSGGMAMGGIKTAAFMVIHNCAAQPDTLTAAKSNLDGMTKLMSFEMKDGKSAMIDINQIDIPAGKKVELKSGGYHVMFMNMKQDLKPGTLVEVTLSFKNAGDIKVQPLVQAPVE